MIRQLRVTRRRIVARASMRGLAAAKRIESEKSTTKSAAPATAKKRRGRAAKPAGEASAASPAGEASAASPEFEDDVLAAMQSVDLSKL